MITKVKNKIKKDQFIIGVSSILTNLSSLSEKEYMMLLKMFLWK